MLGNYLQQTTSADDIFRCNFFLGALMVDVVLTVQLHRLLLASAAEQVCINSVYPD